MSTGLEVTPEKVWLDRGGLQDDSVGHKDGLGTGMLT